MTMIENWPGRGYYRGNKQAMIADAMRLGTSAVLNVTPTMMLVVERKPPPPALVATSLSSGMSTNEAKGKGYTGNSCQDCGSLRMKIAGHCEVCEECGSSSGCS